MDNRRLLPVGTPVLIEAKIVDISDIDNHPLVYRVEPTTNKSLLMWLTRGEVIPITDVEKYHITRFTQAEEKLAFHPRAAKLMGKRKPFIVVAVDEPYFITVYDIIRSSEQRNGTWTIEDERQYKFLTGT